MLHPVRPLDRPSRSRRARLGSLLGHWLGRWLGWAGWFGVVSLAGCPSPAPRSIEAAPRADATPPPASAPPAEPPTVTPPTVEPTPAEPTPLEPTPTPDAVEGPPLPAALAAEGVRPVVRAMWRTIEAIDAGDPDAMAQLVVPDGRWFPPGGLAESFSGASDFRRAMSPWAGAQVALDVRRVIDLGSPFAVQLAVTGTETDPPLRHELLLLVEIRGDLVAAIRHYGDPLGPLRTAPSAEAPLDLGPVGEPTVERGTAEPGHAEVARALLEAIDGRKDAAARALLAEDVVLHDVTASHTRRGRDEVLAAYRATLGEGDRGRLALDRQHAGPGLVIIEGAVHGRDTDADPPQEHGFADVFRVEDGVVAEAWHYVNRRGRLHRPRVQP